MNVCRSILVVLALAWTSPVTEAIAAPDPSPCGGIHLRSGKVVLGRPLPVGAKLEESTSACLEAVGKVLADRAGIRTVTLLARLPNAMRVGGKVVPLLDGYADQMAKGGISRARISGVAPRGNEGENPTIEIAFTEKRAQLPVAVLTAANGQFTAGQQRSFLDAVPVGSPLMVQTYVRTGKESVAVLDLADGSRLRMTPNSMVLLGRLHLNAKLERVVDLQLVDGNVAVDVAKANGGEFRVRTRHGIAGVRGTRFRVSLDGGKATRLETLHGEVELAGSKAKVSVPAGMGSSVDDSGSPIPPRALPVAPLPKTPLSGDWKRASPLEWAAVEGIEAYWVDLARDAEFSLEPMTVGAKDTKLLLPASLAAGKWFWRVRGVDSAKFVGLNSKTYSFTLAP